MITHDATLQTSPVPVLRWQEASWISDGVHINVDHIFYPPGYVFLWHEHDYAEFSFVDHGCGSNHRSGGRDALRAGDLVFLRPDCRHAFAADAGGSLQFLNCAIPGQLYRELASRYAPHWPWQEPRVHHLDGADRAWLRGLLQRLGDPVLTRDRLQVEAVVVDLLARIARRARGAEAPAWLQDLLADARDPERLGSGVVELAQRAGCSREHLSRLMRRHYGCSPQEYLIRCRLEHAAELLRDATVSIPTVAARSGFGNLANFYRLFARQYGNTPGRWRSQQRPRFA